MNRNMIVPAVIAAGLHGLVLGFKPSPVVALLPEPEDKVEVVRWNPIELPDEIDPPIVSAPSDEVVRPPSGSICSGLEELPHVTVVDPGVITVVLPPSPRIEGPLTTIIPGDLRPNGPGGPDGDSISLLAQLDNSPRALMRTPPNRPPGAGENVARVSVEFVVGKDGTVARAEIVASTDRQFDEACLRAVRRWRFEPGIRRGLPVAFRVMQEFVFNTRE